MDPRFTWRFLQMTVSAGGAIGFDGLAVGGTVIADTEQATAEKLDYNVGAEYSQRDFTATVLVRSLPYVESGFASFPLQCSTHRAKGGKDDKHTDFIEAGFKHQATEVCPTCKLSHSSAQPTAFRTSSSVLTSSSTCPQCPPSPPC